MSRRWMSWSRPAGAPAGASRTRTILFAAGLPGDRIPGHGDGLVRAAHPAEPELSPLLGRADRLAARRLVQPGRGERAAVEVHRQRVLHRGLHGRADAPGPAPGARG